MSGLLELEQDFGATAQQTAGQLSRQERTRNREGDLADAAEKDQGLSMAVQGAAIGAQVGGPVGFFAGALAGFAGSKIF